MIRFVQYTPGRKVLYIEFKFFAFQVMSPGNDPHFTSNHLKKPRKRKTPFVTNLFALDMNYLRIDQGVTHAFAVITGYIHNEKPFRNADLRGRQANAASLFHRVKHVRNQSLEAAVKLFVLDRFSDGKQNWVGVMNNIQ